MKVDVDIQPFEVPNAVYCSTVKYPLNRISVEDLVGMCEDYTNAVFEKAGKQRPRERKVISLEGSDASR